MQGNGFKIGLLVFFFVLSAWYLYPSARNYFIQQRLSGLEEQEREEYERENLQRIRDAKEDALKLGLDLQGGMHVTMEVRTDALIRELAVAAESETEQQEFEEILTAARVSAEETGASIIDAFALEFERRDPDARLSRYFRDSDAGISRRANNAEVTQYLREQADNAIDRAISIIRDRVDRYGVTEPSIQKQGARRVVVELPGIDDPERVRNLLKGTARLEFHLMAEPEELARSLQQAIAWYDAQADSSAASDSLAVAAAEPDSLAAADTSAVANLFDDVLNETENSLLEAMQPIGQGVRYGLVLESDTARVRELLSVPDVRETLPVGVNLLYDANPAGTTEEGLEMYYLLGVRDQVELSGEVITSARVDFDELNLPEVTMVMNSEGSRTWARLTGANVNKNISIVLDGVVYSYPTVISRIVGGRSSITGLASREEAQDIVTVLMSGALPAPVDIVEERTVGPSLGRASIRAGFISVMAGLGLVALFMVFYYRTAGLVANLALFFNIVFIFGILAAFQATLTLPGIAGIVLTIGMAVDANVLIFERIREERATGKTLKAAIDAGYSKAFSAIFDANITTFFVGAILYSFGVGPIQGFAVTLMAGILSSLFTAIIVSRIVFDYMVIKRRMNISYG